MSDYDSYLREYADRIGPAYAELAGTVETLTAMGLGTDETGLRVEPREALQRLADRFAEIDARAQARRADR